MTGHACELHMIDSTVLGAVVDQVAVWPYEFVVQRDGRESEEALQDAPK
jgi:hypothetical protein